MGSLSAACLERQTHHLRQLADCDGFPEPAVLDRERLSAAPRVHWAGASLRIQDHEFKTQSTYGNIAGASLAGLADQPAPISTPYYDKAEFKMGVTGTNGIPRLPGNNNYQVLAAGAKNMGYQTYHTGNMGDQFEAARWPRAPAMQIGFCFEGCKSGAKWSTLYTEIPKPAKQTGHLEVRPDAQVIRIETDASR